MNINDFYEMVKDGRIEVNAAFESVSSCVVATCSATVKRIEIQDDGSLTVVIDHWPYKLGK